MTACNIDAWFWLFFQLVHPKVLFKTYSSEYSKFAVRGHFLSLAHYTKNPLYRHYFGSWLSELAELVPLLCFFLISDTWLPHGQICAITEGWTHLMLITLSTLTFSM